MQTSSLFKDRAGDASTLTMMFRPLELQSTNSLAVQMLSQATKYRSATMDGILVKKRTYLFLT